MILALDTSTQLASVALVTLDGELRSARRSRVTTHSEMLMPMVEEVLAAEGLHPRDVAAIACGAGPGSFTGLRIGLATAKGLCLAVERPLLLISSLAALACRVPEGALAAACIDAFKGEVYAGLYRSRAGELPSAVEPETVLSPNRLAADLAARLVTEPVHLVGDVLSAWPQLAIPGVDTTDRAPPDATEIGRLAALRLARGEHDDPAAAVPTYIRPSEAELHAAKPSADSAR